MNNRIPVPSVKIPKSKNETQGFTPRLSTRIIQAFAVILIIIAIFSLIAALGQTIGEMTSLLLIYAAVFLVTATVLFMISNLAVDIQYMTWLMEENNTQTSNILNHLQNIDNNIYYNNTEEIE